MLDKIKLNYQDFIIKVQSESTSGRWSLKVPKIGPTAKIVAILALINLPVANAGPAAYWGCVQTCLQSMGKGWASAIICPTICAPLIAAPGG